MRKTRNKLTPDPEEHVRKWYEMILNNHAHHTMFNYTKNAFIWYKYGSGCPCKRCNVDLKEKADEYEHSKMIREEYRRIDDYEYNKRMQEAYGRSSVGEYRVIGSRI